MSAAIFMEHLSSDPQYRKWNSIYADHKYFYGFEPGPVARRAVRYHRPLCPQGGTAIDIGCGEGQDLAYLAECGYEALGADFTDAGIAKTRRLLEERGVSADVVHCDLRQYDFGRQFDLVLAINSLQFMGEAAGECLDRVIAAVAPGGVIGLSLFAADDKQTIVRDGIYYTSLSALMARFHEAGRKSWQMLEAAKLWQWSRSAEEPQAFVTLVAQRLATM